MNLSVYENITGFQFVYAVNYESNGFLLTALMFAFFVIVLISLFKIGYKDIWEIMAIGGGLTIVPSAILSTQIFLGISVINIWVPMFFVFITALGVGGLYFTSKN